MKQRLDIYLTHHGMTRSRSAAADLIKRGKIMVNGMPAAKAGQLVDPTADTIIVTEEQSYVGRGGLKLEGALDAFGIDPTRMIVADVGSSTGGFTECVLRRGAQRVYAIDVGTGQLAPALRTDTRVAVMEGTDVRDIAMLQTTLKPATNGEPDQADLAVIDLSFISLTKVLPAIWNILKPGGEAVTLVKPQFEVGASVAKAAKGVIRDETVRLQAIANVRAAAETAGFVIIGEAPSPIAGGDGNIEYFLHLRKSALKGAKAIA